MKRQNKNRMMTTAFWLVIILIFVYIYGHFDPMHSPFSLTCPMKTFTGWSCPFCGVQRAAHAILNGHFLQAIKFNYLIVPATIYAVFAVMAYYELLMSAPRAKRIRHALSSNFCMLLIFAILIAWGVVRNVMGL